MRLINLTDAERYECRIFEEYIIVAREYSDVAWFHHLVKLFKCPHRQQAPFHFDPKAINKLAINSHGRWVIESLKIVQRLLPASYRNPGTFAPKIAPARYVRDDVNILVEKEGRRQ